MTILTIDFETYYDTQFSLSKITTEEYIRSPAFETIGVSVKVDDQPARWFSGTRRETKVWLDQFPWTTSGAIAHNAVFDMAILNWVYNIRPKRIIDTLSMARALHKTEVGGSLKVLAEHYGVGVKGDEVINALGKRRKDFSPEALERYGQYCMNDVELTYLLAQAMTPRLPLSELKLIDTTIRMFTEPKLVLDVDVLEDHLRDVKSKKDALLSKALIDKDNLMSNPKLAETLRAFGIDPPMKVSPTTGKETYAFAKSDEAFIALLEHENPLVQAIVAARLGVKSTLEETRTERFLGIAQRGTLPVPLRYYAAHCLTGDAEVLTPTGWRALADWRGGDIAQWTPEGALRFAPASANQFEVDEELVISNARYHKAAYTKGHTVPGFSGRGVFKLLKAGDLLTQRIAIPLGGSLDGSNGLTELDARLAVMVQADGSIRDTDKDRSVRFGFKKLRKIARCKALLEQAGVAYTVSVESSGVTRIRVARADWGPLVKLLSGETKSFSLELLTAPLTTKTAFMEEIAFWDGDVEPHGKGYTYTTTNEHNAQFVQTMAHITGVSAFISERHREGWSKVYRVYIRRDDETRSEPKHYTTKHHTGAVFCPTTETGYFLMRQNGCITVTGNTGRWGGDDSLNLQNLPRVSPLKKAIKAPDGYVFIDCDSSQIEARVLAWLANQNDLVAAFDAGEDVYKIMASSIYGVDIKDITKDQRFVGKWTILGSGYGMGAAKYQAQLKAAGVTDLTLEDCQYIIDVYRNTYDRIPILWKQAQNALQVVIDNASTTLGRDNLLAVDGAGGIILPNGLRLTYPNLRWVEYEDRREMVYDTKKGRATIQTRIYGGKLVENICQALARIIIGEQINLINARYPVVMTVHDAVGVLAPAHEAEEARAFVETCMRKRPAWAPELPLNCESKMGPSYGG